LEEVFKFFLGLNRFRSRRWINNLVKNDNRLEEELQPAVSALPVADEGN
jgi:hypothetical protein